MIRPVDPRELEKFVDLCIAHSKDAGMDHDEINRMFLRKQLKQMNQTIKYLLLNNMAVL